MAPPALTHLSVGELIGLAGVDPWTLQNQLTSGRPDQISDLAAEFHRAAGHIGEGDTVFAQARSHFEQSYRSIHGTDIINESREVRRARDDFTLSARQLTTISQALQQIAAGLADAANTTIAPVTALDAALRGFDSAAGAADLDADQLTAITTDAAAAVRATGSQVRAGVDAYETLLDTRITAIEANGWTPNVDLDDGAPTAPIPARGTDPSDVNRWWSSLGAAERQRITAEHPDQIGALDGIPVADRSAANERIMHGDIDAIDDIAAAHHVTPAAVLERPDLYPGYTPAQAARYGNAVRARDGLTFDSKGGQYRTSLLEYDPTARDGKGAVAIAIGDPDTAANTTVIVPGTGNSVSSGWLTKSDALNVYEQARQADPSHPTAVVAWMGYHTPDSPTDPRIATPDAAREASHYLAADVNGLRASHDPSVAAHTTVVGHSYGSAVVADAAVNGMRTNDVVLIGPPGTDLAENAEDFHLDGGHVYVGAASADPISQIGEYHGITDQTRGGVFGQIGLGADPAGDGFGATRFKAQVPGMEGEFDFSAHSHYYDVGNESLHNIVTIGTGHGDRLDDQGMTAPLRESAGVTVTPFGWIPGIDTDDIHIGIPGLPQNYDAEVDREATTGLEFDAATPGKHY